MGEELKDESLSFYVANELGPQLCKLPHRATRLGGLPHLSCKHDQIKMRDYIERLVTPPSLDGLPHLPGVPHLLVNKP